MADKPSNGKWWIGSAITLILALIGILTAASATNSRIDTEVKHLQSQQEDLKENKVDKEVYQSDMGYIKESLKEIKTDLKEIKAKQ
jgi:hypothetical protein